jgi:AcrR family transcriptional regulator
MAPDRKSTQRERLIDALIATAGRDGYANTNIARMHKAAGVSRRTYYEYFTDRDACFLAALEQVSDQVADAVKAGVEGVTAELAVEGAVWALLDYADERSGAARLLFDDGLRGPAAALEIREDSLARAGAIIDAAHNHAADGTAVPRIPAVTLLGGIYRLLAPRLRAGRPNQLSLLTDLMAWADSYRQARPNETIRIGHSTPPPPVELAHAPPSLAAAGPPAKSDSDATTRTRILQAIAALAAHDGYSTLTIERITETAAVNPRTFDKHFITKQQAYAALQQHYSGQLIGLVASANTGSSPWPRRIWNATRDAAQYLEENPKLAWSLLVGGYAAGDEAISQIESGALALTLHLEEGYRHVPERAAGKDGGNGPPRLALEAIARSAGEACHRAVREGGENAFRRSVPEVAWIALAPFLGADAAEDLIDDWLAQAHPPA